MLSKKNANNRLGKKVHIVDRFGSLLRPAHKSANANMRQKVSSRIASEPEKSE